MPIRRSWPARFVAPAVAAVLAVSLAPAAHASPGRGITHDPAAHRVTMCGHAYCLAFDYDHQARIRSLRVAGHELLDPAEGVYSAVTVGETETTSRKLADSPHVDIHGDTVTATFSTGVADERWTFTVGSGDVSFRLARTYTSAATVTDQGTPAMVLAQDAVEQMRWAGDGGNYPLGGTLVDTYQPSWLAAGTYVNPKLRTAKAQDSYTLLDGTTRTALRVRGSTNHDDAARGVATELRRVVTDAGDDLRLDTVTAASGLQYANGNPFGYNGQVTKDGTPVYKPVQVQAGQQDVVTLDFAPDDYDAYYDLGTLHGVDEAQLSHAINDYGRWMMQDTDLGASTENSVLQTEVPPLEMQWIGQLLELFPEPGALHSFQRGLEDIRDYLVDKNTGQVRCCTAPAPGAWGLYYGDHASGYALGVAKAYQLTGDRKWLASMAPSVDRAFNYLLTEQSDPATHLIENHNPDLTEAGYDNNYWESSTGRYDGYSSALFYDALTQWTRLADVLGDDAMAAKYRSTAATLKLAFNRDVSDGGFWSPKTHTFLYGSGNADALYLPVNAEVLKTDLASDDRKREVVAAIERQDADGNYDLHPMNVRDLFTAGATAPTAGKGGEDGGWYGAPEGDYYAGMPLTGDPQLLQSSAAAFLTRYQADGFHGGSTWDRDDPLTKTASAVWFPTTVMPAWGLYEYGYGFQPRDDRLVLAPFITADMTGSTVKYTWRGTPLRVGYPSQRSFTVTAHGKLTTPLEVHWQNQQPGRVVHVVVDGRDRPVRVDAAGEVVTRLPAGTTGRHAVSCDDCTVAGHADDAHARSMATSYERGDAKPRNDHYDQVGAKIAVGPRPLTVTSLGRYKLAGNHQTHLVKILDSHGRRVAATTVDMTRKPDRRGFVDAPLAKPVTLPPGIYYVYSSETPRGDSWYGAGGTLHSTADVAVVAAAHGRDLAASGPAGGSYGPVTFGYTVAGEATSWMEASVTPASASARSGGDTTFTVTVWGQADAPIDGTVTAQLPAGWTATAQPFTVPTHGDPASVDVPVTVHVPADAATDTFPVTLAVSGPGGLSATEHASVTVANLLYAFDDGTTQGWQGDSKVGGLHAVTSIANGPGTPYDGSHLLEVSTGTVSGPDDPRTVYVEPSTPLDLSNASTFYVHVDSWGVPPYTQTHRVKVTLYDGDDSISATSDFSANVWNRADVDVSSWAGRSHITRIEVTYTLDIAAGASYQVYVDLDGVGFDA